MTKDMTQGNPMKLIVGFALPLLFGFLFQQFYNLVDTVIVGRFLGVNELAGVGATGSVNFLVIGFCMGVCNGFSIPVAHKFGAGDYKGMRKYVANSAWLGIAFSVVLTTVTVVFCRPILELMKTPEDIIDFSYDYIVIIFAAIPFTFLYNIIAGVIRALGDSRTPLMAMITAALTNVALDLLFVLVFKWGIAGAASATIIAQGVSVVYCFSAIRRIDMIRINRQDIGIHAAMSKRLLIVGLPIVFQNTMISIGGMILQSVVNSYGFLFVAGYTAANKLYGLLETAAISFGFAITTYTAQNLGAGNFKRIRKGMRNAVIMALITSVVVSVCMLIFGRPILRLFISNETGHVEEVLGIAYLYLSIMSWFLAILYALHTYRSALQGLGNTVVPMLSGIIEFIMRTTAVMLLPRFVGEKGVFYAEVLVVIFLQWKPHF